MNCNQLSKTLDIEQQRQSYAAYGQSERQKSAKARTAPPSPAHDLGRLLKRRRNLGRLLKRRLDWGRLLKRRLDLGRLLKRRLDWGRLLKRRLDWGRLLKRRLDSKLGPLASKHAPHRMNLPQAQQDANVKPQRQS
jgi:hypothetical protein